MTQLFSPPTWYQVPRDGWYNYEDTPGNFLLGPPGNDLPGVNAGTSDYIGIYTAVVPARFTQLPECATAQVNGVAEPPEAMAAWLRRHHTLEVTRPDAVRVGGFQGVVVDIRTKSGAQLPHCRDGSELVSVEELFKGLPPSDLDHGVIPGMTMRLYLLRFQGGVLAVELDDIDTAPGDLSSLSAVVDNIRFAV